MPAPKFKRMASCGLKPCLLLTWFLWLLLPSIGSAATVLVTAQLQHLPLHSTVEMHVDSAGITHPDPDRILTDGRFSPVTQGQLVPGFSAHHY